MFKFGKKITAMILAGAMVTATAVSSFAAGSPTAVYDKNGNKEAVNQAGTLTDVDPVTSKVYLDSSVKKLGMLAFEDETVVKTVVTGENTTSLASKCMPKNLKTLKINTTKKVKVNKDAFKSVSKSKRQKIVVKVNRKMSKKNYKYLVKQLVKAGIPKKNIKRVKM